MQTSHSHRTVKLGQKVVLVGLFIQIIAFGMFMLVTVNFHIRIHKNPTRASLSPSLPWVKHLSVLYAASILIMIRSLVRVIEYAQGDAGYIISHEAFLYIFDGTLMFISLAIFNWIHPSELIPGETRQAVHSEGASLQAI